MTLGIALLGTGGIAHKMAAAVHAVEMRAWWRF